MSNEVLSELLLQEHELQFNQFNHNVAWELGVSLKRTAESLSASVTIEVYAFERVLFSYAMSGTSSDNQDWVKRKRQSVIRFGHSSYYLGQYNILKQREFESQQHIDATQYCAHGGAFPIRIKGNGLVGVVTVSGLPQKDDHNLVVTVLRDLMASP
ncbi:heme-degrading domain-containing protein [Photobacterium makurazakiensis]|uniref:heme-degrading domain-containing protein n=1 Tax=Photobacterium makurazakiensis TaxID=2910234 RepID=UPI003D0EC98A